MTRFELDIVDLGWWISSNFSAQFAQLSRTQNTLPTKAWLAYVFTKVTAFSYVNMTYFQIRHFVEINSATATNISRQHADRISGIKEAAVLCGVTCCLPNEHRAGASRFLI
jgi:hypothetical protein